MADGTAQQCGRVGSRHILLKTFTLISEGFFMPESVHCPDSSTKGENGSTDKYGGICFRRRVWRAGKGRVYVFYAPELCPVVFDFCIE